MPPKYTNPNDPDALYDWLEARLDKLTGPELLAIPGVFEIMIEEYNNEWIEACEATREGEEG